VSNRLRARASRAKISDGELTRAGAGRSASASSSVVSSRSGTTSPPAVNSSRRRMGSSSSARRPMVAATVAGAERPRSAPNTSPGIPAACATRRSISISMEARRLVSRREMVDAE
jgi:hypothetical protein